MRAVGPVRDPKRVLWDIDGQGPSGMGIPCRPGDDHGTITSGIAARVHIGLGVLLDFA